MKILLVFALFLSGCASTKMCNRKSAEDMGAEDAANWDGRRSRLDAGSKCDGEYASSSFKSDYMRAYRATLKNNCTASKAQQEGAQAADALDFNMQSLGHFNLCADVDVPIKPLESAFKESFKKRLCGEEGVGTRAMQTGKNMAEKNLSFAEHCPKDQQQALKKVYEEKYKEGISAACSPVPATRKGLELAKSGASLDSELSLYERCPPELQDPAVQALQSSYQQERSRILQEELTRKTVALMDRQLVQNSRTDFYVKGHPLTAVCRVEGGRTTIQVSNPGSEWVSFSAVYLVEFTDANSQFLQSKSEDEYLSLTSNDTETFSVFGSPPYRATACRVRKVDVRS